MEDKKKIKVSIGAIFAILEFILILIFAGIVWYASTKTEIKKIDNSKELVYTEKKSFEKYDINKTYESTLPIINLNYENVKKVNKDIQKDYAEYKKYCEINYKSYLNDNILSVLIEKGEPYYTYTTYNIDIYTGKFLDNIELLYYKDFQISEIDEKIEDAIEYSFKKNYYSDYADLTTEQHMQALDEDLSYTLSWNSRYSPMFLDNNGEINIIAKFSTLLGGDSYSSIVNLEKELIQKQLEISTFNSSFEFYIGKSSDLSVINLLDKVIGNNKTNSENIITVEYNDQTAIKTENYIAGKISFITKTEEIIELKKSFESGKEYVVSLGYNEEGLVNKVTIQN